MRGILDKMDEDISITRKLGNGSSVTYKSPKGSQIDMSGILGGMVDGYTPSPVSDNKQINVTPGEFVVNQPAAQKYKGILEKINNEGRQMLAQGGWTSGHKMGYAEGGGIFGSPASYDQLQEDLPYIEDQLTGGANIADLAKYYGVSPMQMQEATAGIETGSTYSDEMFNRIQEDLPYIEEMVSKGATAYELAPQYNMKPDVFKAILDDSGVESGSYATDNTPIVSSGNPAKKATEFAEVNGLDHSDYVMETLEALAREAIQDWASLPEYEKAEWGSIDELIDYYMNDGATEAGLYDSHYVDDQNFANGGSVGGNKFLQNAEFVSRVSAAAKKGLPRETILQEALNNPRVNALLLTDSDTQMLEDAISELTGTPPVEGYWTGGEVGKGDPEEGDTFSHKGQTVHYRDGNWVYNSGTAAPPYVLKAIDGASSAFAAQEEKDSKVEIEKESHAKNYAWGKRAIEAEKVIQELTRSGFNPGSFEYAKGETAANFLGDLARSEDGQRYKKAVESLVAAVLRKDTGAAIAADEFDRTYRQLFPAFGTGKKAQEDVANQRLQNIRGFIDSSGPGADALTKQSEGLFDEGSVSDSPIFTGEDYGGMIGGIIGGVPGGIFGGPIGAALGSAGGTYLGRSIGQWLSSDDDILESLTPEASDIIDTALSGIGGGAVKIGSSAYKAAKAEIARRMAKNKTTDARAVSDIAGEVAEKGLIKGVASAVSGKAGKIGGKIAPHIGDAARKEGWQYVSIGSKPFFRKADGTIIDGVTGSITKGRTATQVNKALGPIKTDPLF